MLRSIIARRYPIGTALCIVLMAASCTVGSAPPATLNADLSGADNVVLNNAPGLFDATATPIRTALPRDAVLLHLLDGVQTDQLLVTVNALAAMRTRHIFSGNVDPPHGIGIAAARDYILAHFRAFSGSEALRIWTQPVTVALNRIVSTSDNVIALLPGTDPTAGTIVIGAHYDTQNVLDPYSADLSAPGADDNASGVTALFTIAQALLIAPPHATVILVAFTAGESGSQGSAAFVNAYLNTSQPPIVPRAMLNLDTIGGLANVATPAHLRLFSDDPDQSASRQFARWLSLIISAYPELPAPIVQSQSERNGRVGDQQVFSASAIPAAHLIEGIDSAASDRSSGDTIESIAPDYLTSATRVALVMALSLADGTLPPSNLAWHSGESALSWAPVANAAGYVVYLRASRSLPDQILVLPAETRFTSGLLHSYGTAAVCAFDAQGLIGQAAPEVTLR